MPEAYYCEEQYKESCFCWAEIAAEMNQRFQPNPWVFKYGYRPWRDEMRFIVTFRNFDNSLEITADYDYRTRKLQLSSPRPTGL